MRRFFPEIVAAERRMFAPVEESNKSGDLSAVSCRRRCITSRSPVSGWVYQSVSASSDLVQAELLFPAHVDDAAALLLASRARPSIRAFISAGTLIFIVFHSWGAALAGPAVDPEDPSANDATRSICLPSKPGGCSAKEAFFSSFHTSARPSSFSLRKLA